MIFCFNHQTELAAILTGPRTLVFQLPRWSQFTTLWLLISTHMRQLALQDFLQHWLVRGIASTVIVCPSALTAFLGMSSAGLTVSEDNLDNSLVSFDGMSWPYVFPEQNLNDFLE